MRSETASLQRLKFFPKGWAGSLYGRRRAGAAPPTAALLGRTNRSDQGSPRYPAREVAFDESLSATIRASGPILRGFAYPQGIGMFG